MRLRIFSDIHLEFCDFEPPHVPCDAVIMAGDIGLGEAGVHWLLRTFPETPVFYVLGNHEFYRQRFDTLPDKVRALCEGTSIRFLNGDAAVFDGVRFLGTTLWTDFMLSGNQPLAMQTLAMEMNDYHKIRIEDHYRRLRPTDTLHAHLQARHWLGEQLEEPFAGKTVVITHHAPLGRSLDGGPRFENNSLLRNAYASDLTAMMGRCALWVHGHAHNSSDYEERGTRVLSNPRGYVPDAPNAAFDPGMVVDL